MHRECTTAEWSVVPCQIWPRTRAFSTTKIKYAEVKWRGQVQYVHRIAWALRHGRMVEDLTFDDVICHHCDNPRCFEPAHLFLGTRTDNANDMFAKGRHRVVFLRPTYGEEHPAAKLTEEDVRAIRATYIGRGGHKSERPTQRAIAEKYGVTQALVGMIVRRAIWRHI